jgi:predicted membrane channel-forming protein YqfA (hemolysin III family)
MEKFEDEENKKEEHHRRYWTFIACSIANFIVHGAGSVFLLILLIKATDSPGSSGGLLTASAILLFVAVCNICCLIFVCKKRSLKQHPPAICKTVITVFAFWIIPAALVAFAAFLILLILSKGDFSAANSSCGGSDDSGSNVEEDIADAVGISAETRF